MNNSTFLLAALLLSGASMTTAQTYTSSATSSLSLSSYTDRSTLELRQLRAQIDAVAQQTPLVGQSALAPYVDALSAAEQSLADFRTAPNIELERRQADLERAKERAVRLWNDYRATRGAAGVRVSPSETPATGSTP